MGKSNRPTSRQLLAVVRLIGECRDLAHDSDLWHRHCLLGLSQMLGAVAAIGGEGTWLRPGHPLCLHQTVRVGVTAARETTHTPIAEPTAGSDPFFREMSATAGKLVTFRRADLLSDAEWYTTPAVCAMQRVGGTDDVLSTALELRPDGSTNVLMFRRAWGDIPFSDRDKQVLHAFHRELAPLIGSVLATIRVPGARGLPPRMRQTLELVVRGWPQKLIALELGVSQHTAREYVEGLKVHFGAHSTAELISSYLGRNRLPKQPDAPTSCRNCLPVAID